MQLEYEGAIKPSHLYSPSMMDDSIIILTHDPNWWSKAKNMQLSTSEYRDIGFPNCPELVNRSISSASGTLQSALFALEDGAGMNLAGGTHHAFFDRGEGFCLINDVAIASNYLLNQGLVRQILIVDLDVHQGNGTARIFLDVPNVFTFSMHCRENYPFKKEKSDLDIELPAGTGDDVYLFELAKHIPRLYEELKPDLVFFVGGVDVLGSDALGRLSLSREGCRLRDKWVIQEAAARKIPLVLVMGGGYSERMNLLVSAHCETYKLVLEHYEKKPFPF